MLVLKVKLKHWAPAQWVRCLQSKSKDGVHPQNSSNKPGVMVCSCNLNAEEAEMCGFLWLACQLAYSAWWSPGQ